MANTTMMHTLKWNDIIAGLALLHVCGANRTYRSRPDLAPPHLNITIAASSQVEQGCLFVAPYSGNVNGTPQSGPYIVDNSGDLVWSGYGYFGPTTANFQPARWNGQHVLFGYEGTLNPLKGHGHGHHKIVDQHYQTIREVRSAGHYLSDMHEFNVNEKTVLVGSYTPREIDLLPYGGDEDQTWIIEYILQELDIGTGEILFEWHSLDHTSPQESTLPLGSQAGSGDNSSTAWDYLHVNSITKGEDGHYLISARSASTLYKLNSTDGSVIWRLGGKSSDFALGPGVEFAFQHHARYFFGVLDTISFFDNSAGVGSAGKIITLDFDKWTATLKQGFYPPHPIFALSQGSTQILPNGNALVNWGSADQITEFNSKGDVLFHAYLESGMRQQYTQNYRAFRGNWTGISPETPAVATEQGEDGKTTVWVSWNGDTATAVWRIWWSTALNLKSQDVPRQGFETRYEILEDAQVHNVYVEALDKEGKVLRKSESTRGANSPFAPSTLSYIQYARTIWSVRGNPRHVTVTDEKVAPGFDPILTLLNAQLAMVKTSFTHASFEVVDQAMEYAKLVEEDKATGEGDYSVLIQSFEILTTMEQAYLKVLGNFDLMGAQAKEDYFRVFILENHLMEHIRLRLEESRCHFDGLLIPSLEALFEHGHDPNEVRDLSWDAHTHTPWAHLFSSIIVSNSLDYKQVNSFPFSPLSTPFKPNMSILPPTLIALAQNNPVSHKVLGVMIRLVLLYTLPSHIHDITTLMSIQALLEHSTRTAEAPVYMAHDVRPERPCAVVPGRGSGHIDRGPGYRRALGECLRFGREVAKMSMSDKPWS
ncbi:secreted protein [Seiridium cupressi]